MVGCVKGFDPLFEIYLSVIAYGRSQINISENPLPIIQKTHFLTITYIQKQCYLKWVTSHQQYNKNRHIQQETLHVLVNQISFLRCCAICQIIIFYQTSNLLHF